MAQALRDWVQWLVGTFRLDGLRVDTVKHVPKSFWSTFQQAANQGARDFGQAGCFLLGEVYSGECVFFPLRLRNTHTNNVQDPVCRRLPKVPGLVPVVPDVPHHRRCRACLVSCLILVTDVFARSASMVNINNRFSEYYNYFTDASVLATFVDNHDVNRFANTQSGAQCCRLGSF